MAGGDDEDERAKRGKTELNQDMIIEILLRLPAESLAQFKFVSRFWYEFIRSRDFINMYQNRNFNPKKQVSLYCRFKNSIPCGTRTTTSFRFYDKIVDLNLPIVPEFVSIVGCSNGVVCMSLSPNQDEFLLWNPATKELKRVPKLLNVLNSSSTTRFTSGFWYDFGAHTFKVVRVKFSSNGQEKMGAQVHIFSSAESSWRLKELVLDDVPICSCIKLQTGSRVTCVKRCMYWLTGSLEDDVVDGQRLDHTCLLCFDMVDEVFKRVVLPRFSLPFFIMIASYKDSLAMFVMQNDGLNTFAMQHDMWVMNDCCERNQTWTKQKTFRGVDLPMGFYGEDENNNWKVVDYHVHDYYLHDEQTGKREDFFENEVPYLLVPYHETLAPLN